MENINRYGGKVQAIAVVLPNDWPFEIGTGELNEYDQIIDSSGESGFARQCFGCKKLYLVTIAEVETRTYQCPHCKPIKRQ